MSILRLIKQSLARIAPADTVVPDKAELWMSLHTTSDLRSEYCARQFFALLQRHDCLCCGNGSSSITERA